MQRSLWTPEAQLAYVACAIDTDGWVSLRLQKRDEGGFRITSSVGVTNMNKEFLERIAHFAKVPENISRNGRKGRDRRGVVTRQDVWQSYWRSPIHVFEILSRVLPYLIIKRQRAEWTLEFAESRISPRGMVYRSGRPYTRRDVELCRLVIEANGSNFDPPEKLPESHGTGRLAHGASYTPEYTIWKSAKHRVAMIPRWHESFDNFLGDIGPRPTPRHQLTRLLKDQPHSPHNSAWAIRGQLPD